MKTCPICETAYPNEFSSCEKDGALLVPAAELDPGTLIRGKYRILRTLGQGGMGTVYLAEHPLLGRRQALKFIASDLSRDPRFIKRFRHEAQAAIELRHPNIVEVMDLDQAENGTPYIAMEFVNGPDLRGALAAGPLPVERALTIARGVALGLGAAHAKGIVHRDLKPENVLLAGGSGEPETPKLADFGLAAISDTANALSRTRALMLTPEYAAPEQWRGMTARELDGRTDLYALGGVLFEMLTGRMPFEARTTEGWMYEHLQTPPAAPSTVRPELAYWQGLDALVLRLLAKDRELRTPSAAALVEALSAVRFRRVEPRTVMQPDNQPVRDSEKRITGRPQSRPAVDAGLPQAAPLAVRNIPARGEEADIEPMSPAFRWTRIVFLGAAALTVVAVVLSMTLPAGTIEGLSQRLNSSGHSSLAAALSQLACTRGDGHACNWLGTQYFSGAFGNSDPARANEFFSLACNYGDFAGCLSAGQSFELGLGVTRSFPRAVAFYTRDCDLGDANGCAGLGRMYEQGSGVEQDYTHAVGLFARACEQNSSDGCEGLGRSYRDGHGVRADMKTARSLFEKAQLLSSR